MMQKTILIPLLFLCIGAIAQCKICSIETILKISDHLDSITIWMVDDFLCTFNDSCLNNAEFTEFWNETLFIILLHKPEVLITSIQNHPEKERSILKEISNPVNDGIDLEAITQKLSNLPESQMQKTVLLAIVRNAKNKQ